MKASSSSLPSSTRPLREDTFLRIRRPADLRETKQQNIKAKQQKTRTIENGTDVPHIPRHESVCAYVWVCVCTCAPVKRAPCRPNPHHHQNRRQRHHHTTILSGTTVTHAKSSKLCCCCCRRPTTTADDDHVDAECAVAASHWRRRCCSPVSAYTHTHTLTGRQTHTWRSFDRNMYFARAVSRRI